MSHQLWLGGIIAGISYAWFIRRRDHLADALQAHAVTNGLTALSEFSTSAA